METRKLIKSGPSSLLISLPNQWIKSHKLKKGSTVSLEVQNDSILVSTAQQKHTKESSYTITDNSLVTIKEKLTYAFLHNYKNINIKTDKIEAKDIINIVNNYPGLECKIERNKIVVQNLLNKQNIKPYDEFKRILQLNDYVLDKIKSLEGANVSEVLLVVKNLKRKCLIVESIINENIIQPYQSKLKLNDLVVLKLLFQELPLLFDNELRLMRQLANSSNPAKYKTEFKLIEKGCKILLQKKQPFETRLETKTVLERLRSQIDNSSRPRKVAILGTLHAIHTSLLRMDTTLDSV